MSVVQADLAWIDGRFVAGAAIAIADDGRIAAVGPDAGPPTRRLAGCAVLPGFVNAHSHAFQRGLRGLGETFPAGAGSFWTWREAMYGLVESLDAPAARALSRRAFEEMLDAGITTVGEFHYLRHGPGPEDRFALDDAVLGAAADAGIRIVLLVAHYRTGGIGAPLAGGQRRFDTASLEDYWDRMDRLAERLGPHQHLGAVAHSIRAVPRDDLAPLHAEARRRGMVLHMHLEEQPAEIEACRAAYGATPLAVVREEIPVDGAFTAVHLTHSDPADLEPFLAAGGRPCLCPLTEANLGDGLADVARMRDIAAPICLGSDSNARISMLEEMRWLEYGQRLRRERRGVCLDAAGAVGPALLDAATRHGAASLGLASGAIRPGAPADLTVVDLAAPSLEGTDASSLAAALALGAADDAIAGVLVGGRWRARRGGRLDRSRDDG